ncbi:HD domain-containing phosphohydrolase [Curvibacter sp. APW13]|uniref:HD-GYP domain-containing protein n=1 Tax=Curvibacter sp. APW13 TaxID=3077236 RepID=UPI0028DE57D9|nr:HD domain-containing phosphohydrolase [Curvibacter sp. APW13]MDT8991491.1 HD domain-containing phosphohydrolase [Curvibacter sp. APW13]
MKLPWNVRDENRVLLLSKGHIILEEAQLDELLERGAFVDEEEVRAAIAEAAASKTLISGRDPRKSLAAVNSVYEVWDQTTDALKRLLTDELKEPDFPTRMLAFAQHLIATFDVNPEYGIYRIVRQDHAQNFFYGYTHAVYTATVCLLITRHLQWPPSRVLSVVQAALTMNMGILDLQGQMAAQDYPVRDRQRAMLTAHPQQALEQLRSHGITDPEWLQAVEQHHERADGSGYPTGCTDISEMAALLRVADVFVGRISPRTLHPAIPPKEAIGLLYREQNGSAVATALIKEFGIYPPGDCVKLASGEVGVVVQRTDNPRAPIVAVLTDAHARPMTKTVRRNTDTPALSIVESVHDKNLLKNLAPERLYGFAAMSAA